MGRKLVPSSTIKARMDAKDRRFEQEAKLKAVKKLIVDGLDQYEAKMNKLTYLMSHEQRQELIRRPITFRYYGGKAAGGTSIRTIGYIGRDGDRTSFGSDMDYYND